MPTLPGSGIRIASIPLATTIQTTSPPPTSEPSLPPPTSGGGGTGAGAAGLIGLLLLALGMGGALLTGPSQEEQTQAPSQPAAPAAVASGPLEVPPSVRLNLMP